MNKKIILLAGVLVVLGGAGYWIFLLSPGLAGVAPGQKIAPDPKNATYFIEGKQVKLENGESRVGIEGGTVSATITRYFGNEAVGDFNGDGVDDVAFLLTQDSGGTGIFYYVAALLSGKGGYLGSNAVFLGDRIAPQATEYRGGKIVVNYMDRKMDEPMAEAPSVGVSKYFLVIDNQLREANPIMSEAEARIIAGKSCIKGGEALGSGSRNETTKTWWFDANLNATKPGCNPACVVSEETKTAKIDWRCIGITVPDESTKETLRQQFAVKYPKYAKTISIVLEKGTEDFIRGNVSMDTGVPGGIFFAEKTGGKWQIVFDGNGPIPCNLSKYGIPGDMLSDCAQWLEINAHQDKFRRRTIRKNS